MLVGCFSSLFPDAVLLCLPAVPFPLWQSFPMVGTSPHHAGNLLLFRDAVLLCLPAVLVRFSPDGVLLCLPAALGCCFLMLY